MSMDKDEIILLLNAAIDLELAMAELYSILKRAFRMTGPSGRSYSSRKKNTLPCCEQRRILIPAATCFRNG